MSRMISQAFIWSRLLGVPFWVMLNTLSVLLYKEFHVSPLLVTLLIVLKPTTALFASHWSCFFSGKNKYFILTNILRFTPFLFFFAVNSAWMIIGCFFLYMVLSRGSVPVWTELFKNHLPKDQQHRLFAFGNTFEYLGMTIFPIMIGMVLDYNANLWRLLFPLTACIGLTSTLLMVRLPNSLTKRSPMQKTVFLPWKNAFTIIKSHRDFRIYLFAFMLGGSGLMVIQPVLPIFFVDELKFSYTAMMMAISVCKGVGYVISSPFWVRLFKRFSLFQFSFLVILFAFCFPLILIGAKWRFWLCYIAYIGYGFMQSGSELSWHLSPAIFSSEQRSLPFTETNILAVGLRGCFIPFLGSFLFYLFNSFTVMMIGSLFCLLGAFILINYKEKVKILSKSLPL
ncbi:MAG: MFS transporter [Chlamydiales bacterium]